MIPQIDHKNYPKKLKSLDINALHYIIKDCQEAINANPDNPKNGYYADEINLNSRIQCHLIVFANKVAQQTCKIPSTHLFVLSFLSWPKQQPKDEVGRGGNILSESHQQIIKQIVGRRLGNRKCARRWEQHQSLHPVHLTSL